MSVQERIGMPLDEFIRAYDEAPFELIDGERRPIMPGVSEHSFLIKLLYDMLREYEQAYGTVRVLFESPFVLADTPDWVEGSRVPDVMVYLLERLTAYQSATPGWKRKPLVLVPDLCIEVISQNDRYEDVDEKVERYLSDGVRLVWVVNPRTRSITVRVSGSNQFTRLTVNDTLDGGDVLPGFALPVREIFPE